MDIILEIKDLNFGYNNNMIFENLNLKIKSGDFVTIAGNGKTTLAKILLGLLKSSSEIVISGDKLTSNSSDKIRKNIGFVIDSSNMLFSESTVYDELKYNLIRHKTNKKDIEKNITEVTKMLDINHLLDYNPNLLSSGERSLVSIALALSINPSILIFDNAFNMLDELIKEKILKILKKLNKDKKITIINLTNSLEESFFGKRLILLDGDVILNESVKKAFNNDKLFNDLNLELPFIVDLSKKLQYYDLIDDVFLDINKMVDFLWK